MRRCIAAGLISVLLAVSCATRERSAPRPYVEFSPSRYLSSIHLDSGSYPALYSEQTYAVWVDPEVARIKRDQALLAGEELDPRFESEAFALAESFVVVECHIESVFADSSIAYDAVALRNIEVELRLPDERGVQPVMQILGTPVEEESRGALKLFRRTNLLVFRRKDLWMGRDRERRALAEARLTLKGYDSTFYFAWPQAPVDDPWQWVPTPEEAHKLTVTGFRELFMEVRRQAHRFD